MKKLNYYSEKGSIIPGSRPPRYSYVRKDSLSRAFRMPDQPKHILNVTLGYDYRGFSARLSYLYQSDKVTYIDVQPLLDKFTGPYARWDLSLQQKLVRGFQVYVNFNNLNNRPDESFSGHQLNKPTYTEYYGLAIDAGIRFTL
jgi:outer membrane receptor protein involved in Fe transport